MLLIKRLSLYCLTVIALILAGCSCNKNGGDDGPANNEKEETDLLICTFNIRYPEPKDTYTWDLRKDAVCKFILTRKPDIIGLQEVERSQAEYIFSKVKDEYALYGIGRGTGKNILETNVIESSTTLLYRKERFSLQEKKTFWHSDNPDQVSLKNKANDYGSWHTTHEWTTSWVKLIDNEKQGMPVWFFNTHYQNNNSSTIDIARSREIRAMQSNLHLSLIPQIIGGSIGIGCTDPVFLVGDFNTSSSSDELQILINNNLGYARTDALKSSFRTTGTFNGWSNGSSIIDHIFFCGPLKALVYSVDKRNYGVSYISDHYPVLTEFSYTID